VTTSFTQDQNLLFQSYFTVALLTELKNNNLLESAYYDGMTFGAPWIKDALRQIGIDNQGCALMALYVMLVLPRELIQRAYTSDYDDINRFLQGRVQNTVTTYNADSTSVDHLRHIRNAVAHARVEFRQNDVIIFSDENKRTNETFTTELPLASLGEFIHRLQMVHIAYIRDLQRQVSQTN